MADVDTRKRALNANNNADEEDDDELIGPMPAPPPKPKKKRSKFLGKNWFKGQNRARENGVLQSK